MLVAGPSNNCGAAAGSKGFIRDTQTSYWFGYNDRQERHRIGCLHISRVAKRFLCRAGSVAPQGLHTP